MGGTARAGRPSTTVLGQEALLPAALIESAAGGREWLLQEALPTGKVAGRAADARRGPGQEPVLPGKVGEVGGRRLSSHEISARSRGAAACMAGSRCSSQ